MATKKDRQGPNSTNSAQADHLEVEHLSYEHARDELMQIVAALEVGAATLEESLQLWERGEALAAHCEKLLSGASDRLQQATARSATVPANAAGDPASDERATADNTDGSGDDGGDA